MFEEPYRFDFFQAVRLLGLLRPGGREVGHEGHPGEEVVRFAARLSQAFPPSEVHALDRREGDDGPPTMTVAFMGLTGPSGVLPGIYTELLIERRRAGDRTAGAFLDLFNHRAISLFFRAWAKYRVVVQRERGDGDRFAGALFALAGLGNEALRGRHAFPDDAVRFYAGLFARRQRPAVALEAMLRDYFGVPIEVRQFVGRWLRLDPGDRSTLGASGAHNALGVSVVVGARVRDEQSTIRLRVGPLGFEQFLAFQPGGGAFRPLAEMARLFVDGELEIEVQPVLRAEEVPAARLSAAPGAGARLGRHAWLRSRPAVADADDAVFAGTP